ncbi:hypothetical protein CRG98_025985 [Punica granatum]|uniref:Reverse transcriptase Ty1/copia-type domain-containing protein n=1 Tax=Punica granatum TaxID=22663 RepID=A0A2I0JBI9_PUNGR|nr:hypothetical protein CRG98_025985 [Punica granatum]
MTSRHQSNPGEKHWIAVKKILKYLRRTKEMFLVYGGEEELVVRGYTDASFQSDKDDRRSQSGYVFRLNGGAVSWKSSKQETVVDSTTEAEYIAASNAAKEAVWIKNMLRTAEHDISKGTPVLMVQGTKKKGKGKKKGKKAKGASKYELGALKPKAKVAKDDCCFHFGNSGHWKRNCKVYLEELKKKKGIKELGYIKNEDEACVYKKVSGSAVIFLVLYVDDILLIGNDIPSLQSVKIWLGMCFSMKDLGEATNVLRIKIYRDRSRRVLGLSQSAYVDKVFWHFSMQDSKKGSLPMLHA